MNEKLKNNLPSYLNKDEKKGGIFLFLLILFLFIFILFSFTHKTYNVLNTNAQTVCENNACTLHFYWMVDQNFEYEFIKINEKKYDVEDVKYEEVVMDSSNNGYQEIILKAKEYQGKNKEVVKLQIYKNKERVIKKIINRIMER